MLPCRIGKDYWVCLVYLLWVHLICFLLRQGNLLTGFMAKATSQLHMAGTQLKRSLFGAFMDPIQLGICYNYSHNSLKFGSDEEAILEGRNMHCVLHMMKSENVLILSVCHQTAKAFVCGTYNKLTCLKFPLSVLPWQSSIIDGKWKQDGVCISKRFNYIFSDVCR